MGGSLSVSHRESLRVTQNPALLAPCPVTQIKPTEGGDGESGPGFLPEQKSIWRWPCWGSLICAVRGRPAASNCIFVALPRKRRTFVFTDHVLVGQA